MSECVRQARPPSSNTSSSPSQPSRPAPLPSLPAFLATMNAARLSPEEVLLEQPHDRDGHVRAARLLGHGVVDERVVRQVHGGGVGQVVLRTQTEGDKRGQRMADSGRMRGTVAQGKRGIIFKASDAWMGSGWWDKRHVIGHVSLRLHFCQSRRIDHASTSTGGAVTSDS